MGYYITLIRMAINKNSTNNKCWGGCGEKERGKAWPDTGHHPGKAYGKSQILEGQGTRQMLNL